MADSSSSDQVLTRLYANGRVDLSARAPADYSAAVKLALQKALRSEPKLDRSRFVAEMLGRGVPSAVAERTAQSLSISDEQSFFTPEPR